MATSAELWCWNKIEIETLLLEWVISNLNTVTPSTCHNNNSVSASAWLVIHGSATNPWQANIWKIIQEQFWRRHCLLHTLVVLCSVRSISNLKYCSQLDSVMLINKEPLNDPNYNAGEKYTFEQTFASKTRLIHELHHVCHWQRML